MPSKLIAVISPAKLLDESSRYPELKSSEISFAVEAEYLTHELRKLKSKELGSMMDLSVKLADENVNRFQQWQLPFTPSNSIQAILMFKGDVYRGLKAEELGAKQLEWAQSHLRILSGLYGILRPLDLIQPYRLMMGTPFSPDKTTKNLYQFWGNKLTEHIKADLDPKGVLVNLASSEYFKAVNKNELDRRVVNCEFKEKKGTGYAIVSTYAKQARGKMARFIIENKITKPSDLQAFDTDGYCFNPKMSTDQDYVFTR
jgi:cytoplasmic iron level regulating protein YaaA (DUF328/UPF0246 family)